MKQARMIVSAIAIFAVVGGALAFKAHNSFFGVIYTGPDAQHCTIKTPGLTIAAVGTPLVFASTTSTTSCFKTSTVVDQ